MGFPIIIPLISCSSTMLFISFKKFYISKKKLIVTKLNGETKELNYKSTNLFNYDGGDCAGGMPSNMKMPSKSTSYSPKTIHEGGNGNNFKKRNFTRFRIL